MGANRALVPAFVPPRFTRRDFLKLGGAALSSSLLAGALPGLRIHALRAPGLQQASEPFDPSVIYHGNRKIRTIAMTYDDCWHPEVLEQLMEMVKPYPGFHFTFFAIGEAIDIDEEVTPGIWKRLYDQGHEIGYHTYHHVDPQVMTLSSLQTDFDQ